MKRFLLFLSIVLLLGAGYFTYDKWVKNADLTLWSFVPGTSVLVYETSTPLVSLEEIKQTSIWKNLSYLQEVENIDKNIDLLDSLAGKGNFRNFFAENPLLISLNITSSKSFDFLFVVEIQNLSQQTFISKAQAHFQDANYVKRTREYEGFTITELVGDGPDNSFTYIFYKNYFIGSFSAFLVEDAIRTVSYEETTGFDQKNPELKRLTKLERDHGNVYLNMDRVPALINIFTQDPTNLDLGKSSFLDLKVGDKTANLTGFSFVDQPTQFLSNFRTSSGAEFDIANIIPIEASWFYHFSTKDPAALGTSLQKYYQATAPDVLKYQAKLLKDADFDVNYTFNLMDEEIGLITMESAATGEHHQLLILEVNDMGEALKFFNSAGERHMLTTGDTLYHEQYGNYEIRKLPVANFPYALLGNLARGFEDSYYLQYRNNLVFSNNLQQLKNFTISIENEGTWTKSLRISHFLDQTNKEASFSLFVNTPRAWNQLLSGLKPSWKDYLAEHQFSFKNLEFLAFQFSTVDDKFYTNLTIYQPNLPNRSIPERIKTLRSITLPDFIKTKPWLVTNHNNKLKEVFVQDTANNVYLIGSDFSVIWDKSISAPIISDVRQIDYYKNGKLQYIFATKEAVHILDRTGAYLPEFPKKLAQIKEIEYFGIIDYDNTKNYRYAITDDKGLMYLTDKDLNPLPGWSPKNFEKPLVQAPLHRRIDGKDVIIAIRKDGKLFVLNRKGDNYAGFPLETNSEISDDLFVSSANSLDKSTITLLTTSGELMEIGLKGRLTRREQLYKPGAKTDFQIIEDVTGDAYVILRRTENSYEVLDENGLVLFEKNYFSNTPLHHQYYHLGAGTEFIVFVDPGGSYLYLYDREGQLLTGRPLTATQPISVMQYENEFQIYRAVDRNLELISVSF